MAINWLSSLVFLTAFIIIVLVFIFTPRRGGKNRLSLVGSLLCFGIFIYILEKLCFYGHNRDFFYFVDKSLNVRLEGLAPILFLMSASFVYVALGSFFTLKAFTDSPKNVKRASVVVAVISIIALLSVANSLAHNPRGFVYNTTEVILESFKVQVKNLGNGRYEGSYSELIYSSENSVGSVEVSVLEYYSDPELSIRLRDPIQDGRVYAFYRFEPYDRGVLILNEFVTSDGSQTLEPMFRHSWGGVLGQRVRYEGYQLEFDFRLRLYGLETNQSHLNASVSCGSFRGGIRLRIDERLIISNFQNGLSITLIGIFVAINGYVPSKFFFPHLKKLGQKIRSEFW
jgi:hypothetical protein